MKETRNSPEAYFFLGLLVLLHIKVVEDEKLLLLQGRVVGHLSRAVHREVLLIV